MRISLARHGHLSLSLTQSSMDHTCRRDALFEAQSLPQHHQQQQHEQQQYHHHQQQHHHHHFSSVGGFSDSADELVAAEVNPVSFDVLSQQEKEKQGVSQKPFLDLNFRSSQHNVQAPVKPCDDTHFPSKACEDLHLPSMWREDLKFQSDGKYCHHQLHSPRKMQPRIKLLCSFGGIIMARPVDGKLRYCGGETRIVAVNRSIRYGELLFKMTHIYSAPVMLKYQLPGEDLDALVSVSSDDDLQNMLDEYDRLESSGGTSWLRLFLFTSPFQSEILNCGIGPGTEDCCTDVVQYYIDAINGIPERLSSMHLEDGMDDVSTHYFSQNCERRPFDVLNTMPTGLFYSPKPFLRAPSAPSSAPSSPSVASKQAHFKPRGMGDTCLQILKERPNFITHMNGVDISIQEANQDVFVDTSSTLKCDHQSFMPAESPRIHHDVPFSRGESKWVTETGMHVVDPQVISKHQCEYHHRTGGVPTDTRHDMKHPFGIMIPQGEVHHGNHQPKQVAQPPACQVQLEGDFCRGETVQLCHSEVHKQLPIFHQTHQVIPPLHHEGHIPLQRGPGYDLSCQNCDHQGISPFPQGSGQPHLHNPHVVGATPVYTMGSAPSSPRDAFHGRCNCYQHSQVHRGITVSLGGQSYSRRPFHFGDQSIRKHGLPLSSRFCDSVNYFIDPDVRQHQPNPIKGLEAEQQDQMANLRKHTLERNNVQYHLGECQAKEHVSQYCDPHAFAEPLLPVHDPHEKYKHGSRCADNHYQKGQHSEKMVGYPVYTELQDRLEDHAVHQRRVELDDRNFLAAGKTTCMIPIQDHRGDLEAERCKEGHMDLYCNNVQGEFESGDLTMHVGGVLCDGESSMLLVPRSSTLVLEGLQVPQGLPTLGHRESDRDSNSASFSSMAAVAGSLSRPSLEPQVWLNSLPSVANGEILLERNVGTKVPAADCMAGPVLMLSRTNSYEKSSFGVGMHTGENGGDQSFNGMVSYERAGPVSTFVDVGEARTELLSVSSLTYKVPEPGHDKCRVSHTHPSSHDINYAGSLGPSQITSTISHTWQQLASRTLSLTTLEGSSITLTSPIYDQSPISSLNALNFSFEQSEESLFVDGANGGKEATSQMCVREQLANCMISSITGSFSNDVQSEEIWEGEGDAVEGPPQEFIEKNTGPVLEGSQSLLPLLSVQCSTEARANVNGRLSKVVPITQSRVTSEIAYEVGDNGEKNGKAVSFCTKELEEELPATHAEAEATAHGLLENNGEGMSFCIKELEEELPATQAEAEAIARGLQIIKNDDLEDLRELGSGTYGTVFHGKWRGSDVAIKRIKASCFLGRPSVQERLLSDFWREAGTLSQLHHPNIVAFYGVVPDGPGGTLATVTEYMVNGSLKQVLVKKDRTIDRKKRLLIAMDAAFGMEYLHSKNIVHFDLKSENLLVNMRDAHRPICKVGDFGLSKVKHQTLVSGGVRGTLPWMAPELLSEKSSMVTEKIDVYSFGIVMWELLTGEEPYANMHCGTIIGGIVNDTLRPLIPSWCDPDWRKLMERCWSGDPADRPRFSVVASELRAIASSMNIK